MYKILTQIINATPLVKLQSLNKTPHNILVKLEGSNPSSSVKDRAALSMILKAQERGDINPGDRLIEATSGNTGIALAMISAALGYKIDIIMPSNLSQERKDAMLAYGANLIEVSAEEGMEGARDLALNMQKQGLGKVLDQFNNPDNPLTHYNFTGPEIYQATNKEISHFIATTGTCGTIMGTGRFLKEQDKAIKVIGVQPAEGSNNAAQIPGIRKWREEYLPGFYDKNMLDTLEAVTQEQAESTMRALAHKEGIFAGPSSGAGVYIALKVAEKLPAQPRSTLVTIICDRGDRYLSTGIYNKK